MVRPVFEMNGQVIDPPVDWDKVEVLCRFDNDSVMANTEIENFRFVHTDYNSVSGASIIYDWLEAGKAGTGPGVFEGIPFKMRLTDGSTSLTIIDGYINLVDSFKKNKPLDYSAKIARNDTLNDLNTKLEAVTFGLLKEKLFVVPANYTSIKYLVEKEHDEADILLLEVTIFLVAREAYQLLKELYKDLANVVALVTGLVTAVGAVLLAIAMIALNILFLLKVLKTLGQLIKSFMELLYPTSSIVKGMTLTAACTVIFAYAGYSFSTPIPEMEKVVYLPSKPEGTDTQSVRKNDGIPNPGDYGYRAVEMVELCKNLFLAKLRIDENSKTVELLALNDPKWLQFTAYIAPDVLNETEITNAEELVSSRILSFVDDVSDYWTRENWKGNTYEVQTVPKNTINAQNKVLKGLEDNSFRVALGARKKDFSELEQRLYDVADIVDNSGPGNSIAVRQVASLMNQSAPGVISQGSFQRDLQRLAAGDSLASLVQERTSMLKVGSKYWRIPKVVYQEGGLIPEDHRDHLSAKALWDNYHNYKSFVANNYAGQKVIVTDQRVPFTFSDFLIVSKNKYFFLADGRVGEMTSVKWSFNDDTALISYKVQQVHTRSIDEVKIEAA